MPNASSMTLQWQYPAPPQQHRTPSSPELHRSPLTTLHLHCFTFVNMTIREPSYTTTTHVGQLHCQPPSPPLPPAERLQTTLHCACTMQVHSPVVIN